MPKSSQADTCTECGKHLTVDRYNHYRIEHQTRCTIQFKGENQRTCVTRKTNNPWKCPRCGESFEGSSRKIQSHATQGTCPGTPKCEPSNEKKGQGRSVNYVWKRLQRAAKHSPVVSSPRESGGGILALAEGSGGKTLQAGDDPQGGLTKCIDIELERDGLVILNTPGNSLPVVIPEMKAKAQDGEPDLGVAPSLFETITTLKRRAQLANPHHDNPASPERSTQESSTANTVDSRSNNDDPPSHVAHLQWVVQERKTGLKLKEDSAPRLTAGPEPSTALRAFLATLRAPSDFLVPIFIKNGFNSEATLDLLSEVPAEGHWESMKQEILDEGNLASWLVVAQGLKQRAGSLGRLSR